jgi:hypothetical protein
MEYYSAIKKNEIMLFAGKWVKCEIIMSREVSQAQKDKGHVFPHIWKLGLKDKCIPKYIYVLYMYI